MKNSKSLLDKMLLTQLEWHLDQKYAFRAYERYRGILGWLRALKERPLYEKDNEETGAEHLWAPKIRASGPKGYEEIYRQYVEKHKTDNFSLNLMRLMESKGLDHVEVYKKAGIDRKLFSKIRTNHDYIPGKKTVLALALAMELNLEETRQIMEECGYSFSPHILFDVIVEFFIIQKIYDLDVINTALHKYRQQIF